jgi:trehalose 2-sulfotransferase
MAPPASYLLCGTPRTGSTLLCGLLSSTGVLGHPESYFREPDEPAWARRFGLPSDGPRVRDYDAFVRAVRGAGTTGNGVFAARIMWGSLDRLLTGLDTTGRPSDPAVLERAFGPLVFLHLRRDDVIGQAVSWCRAEQTGFWQQGDVAFRQPEDDLDRMKELLRTIHRHDAAWRSWFERNAIAPHAVSYEELVHDRRRTVEGIAARVGVELPARWRSTSPHRRQADGINVRWAAALRAAMRD